MSCLNLCHCDNTKLSTQNWKYIAYCTEPWPQVTCITCNKNFVKFGHGLWDTQADIHTYRYADRNTLQAYLLTQQPMVRSIHPLSNERGDIKKVSNIGKHKPAGSTMPVRLMMTKQYCINIFKKQVHNSPMTYVTWFVLMDRTSSATSNAIYILIALRRIFRKINTFTNKPQNCKCTM